MRSSNIVIVSIAIVLLSLFYSCGKDPLPGMGTPPKFEHGPVFGRTGGKNVIESKNDVNWSFQGISINGIITYFRPKIDKEGNKIEGIVYYDGDYRFVEPKYPVDVYPKSENKNHSIVGDWFSIEKLDSRHILIKMDENKTGEDIHIKIHLFAGNAVEDIEIEQKAE